LNREPLGGAATLTICSSLIVSFERVLPLGGFSKKDAAKGTIVNHANAAHNRQHIAASSPRRAALLGGLVTVLRVSNIHRAVPEPKPPKGI
jgi:hypothetical protein